MGKIRITVVLEEELEDFADDFGLTEELGRHDHDAMVEMVKNEICFSPDMFLHKSEITVEYPDEPEDPRG